MIGSYNFLTSVLNTITEHIVVIDKEGDILFVNRSWIEFGQSNSCITSHWEGINYLKVCDKSAAKGDEFGLKAAEGIRKVINAEQELFFFEYPCHCLEEKRWFMMRVTSFVSESENDHYYVISHQNITERKLAEEEVLNLSRFDSLTNIPNRRYFDDFLHTEWRRCARLKMPITLAIIDIDHFKLLNDTYGHQVGDECLKVIGSVLKGFTKRPSDICARYGGEEFSIVLGNTTIEKSLGLIKELNNAIRGLEFPNEKSPIMPIVTASIGLATMYPNKGVGEEELITAADIQLYSAKANGRNQIHFNQIDQY